MYYLSVRFDFLLSMYCSFVLCLNYHPLQFISLSLTTTVSVKFGILLPRRNFAIRCCVLLCVMSVRVCVSWHASFRLTTPSRTGGCKCMWKQEIVWIEKDHTEHIQNNVIYKDVNYLITNWYIANTWSPRILSWEQV